MSLFRRPPSPRPVSQVGAATAPDEIPLIGLDHVEVYVGNPQHTARLLTAFGFRVVASQGRHSGVQDLVSYVLRQGTATILVTGGTTPRQDPVLHVAAKGDSVKDVAWAVPSADEVYGTSIRRNIHPEHLPVSYNDEDGDLALCPIASPAGVLHTMIQREAYSGTFCPGFVDTHDVPVPIGRDGESPLLTGFDSVTFAIRPHTLAAITAYYIELFDLEIAEDHTLSSGVAPDLAALRVLHKEGMDISVVLVEPGQRRDRTHLDEFLRLHDGPGVQGLGFQTDDIVRTVQRLREQGLPILPVGDAGAGTPRALAELGIVEEHRDGQRIRSATIGPLQHRAPLVVEVVERVDGAALPIAARETHHRHLAARVAEDAECDVLNTWQAGR